MSASMGGCLYAQQNIAVGKVILERYSCVLIICIGKAAHGRGFYNDFYGGETGGNFEALRGRQRCPCIRWNLSFSYDTIFIIYIILKI